MDDATGAFWDGYIHWAEILEAARDPRNPLAPRDPAGPAFVFHQPVFLQIEATPKVQELTALRACLSQDPSDPAAIRAEMRKSAGLAALADDDAIVLDLLDLAIGLEHVLNGAEVLEFFVYRRVAVPEPAPARPAGGPGYAILDVGPPALVEERPAPAAAGPAPASVPAKAPATRTPAKDGKRVIGAVIDNDIGFLHPCFHAAPKGGTTETAFHAVWLQSRRLPQSSWALPHVGEIYGKAEIDRLLNSGRTEREIYGEINDRLNLIAPLRRPPKKDTHGSAVAGVAFAGLQDGPDAVPLLAVQLPAEAAIDTTGAYSESHIVQGVRWLCAKARALDPGAVLVINVSYGVSAGAKNGSTFLEAQVAREIDLAAHQGQEVHVVYAYGNSRNARLLAEVPVRAKHTSAPLTWVLPPENRMPAFLEVRQIGSRGGRDSLVDLSQDIAVQITPPGPGATPLVARPAPGAAAPPLATGGGAAPCRVYAVPARDMDPRQDPAPAYDCIAIAPTRPVSAAVAPAAAGDWQLAFENRGDTDVVLILQIQRGDTAAGALYGGRQSWFDGAFTPEVYEDWIRWTVAAPLSNAGTNSRYTSAAPAAGAARVHTVAAARAVPGGQMPAAYSAETAPWVKTPGPNEGQVVDGFTTIGLRTIGTYAGTLSRISGTSAAAAKRTNALIRSIAAQV